MAELVTHADAVETLRNWLKALEMASSGQSYSIGGRTLTRQDIPEIRNEIRRWHNTVTAIEAQQRGERRPLGAQANFPTPGTGQGGLYSDELWRDWRT